MSCSRCQECRDYWPDEEIVHAAVGAEWKVLCVGCFEYLRDQTDTVVSQEWLTALVDDVVRHLRPDYLKGESQ